MSTTVDDKECTMRLMPRLRVFLWCCGLLSAWAVLIGAAAAGMERDVHAVATLEMMKGHLIAAFENHQRGQTPLAQAHAAHPLHEQYPELPDTLAREHPALDRQLREALTHLQQGLGSQATSGDVATQVETASELVDQAAGALISAETRHAPAFQAGVLSALLEEIAEEYAEAVQDGKVVNLAEYQDAFGFLQRARALHEPLAGRLPAEERARLQTLWKALEEAMPGVMPPASPVSSKAVEGHVRAITAELKRLP
jgi:inorganic triphosphatase YgiF